MEKNYFRNFFVISLIASMMFVNSLYSQTAGTMTFNVTPATKSGSYSATHFVAVWVEYSSGTFVKTRVRLGSSGNSNSHLLYWKAKSTSNVTDATTGASLTSYTALTYTWNGNDITTATPYTLLPDGAYRVYIEYAWDNSTVIGTGRDTTSVGFIKGGTTYTALPTAVTNFSGMSISWTPAAQNTTAVTALTSTSLCTGASVSVPFTLTGTTTVYNNNVWTAQLSDATGSFASPVSIGTLSSLTGGAIAATIPAGTLPGTGYRIRVVGSQPATIGTDNGANITISAVPAAPTVGTITQPSCTVTTGSVVLTGLPSSGTWTINPGNITGSGTTTTIPNLASGSYNYTVTLGCASAASAAVVINTAPVAPAVPVVGTITQPNCTVGTGSVALSNLPATNWTINPGNISGNTTTYTLTNLNPGNYNFTVSVTGCTSSATATVTINIFPSTPATPLVGNITQPNCTLATGSVVLSGLPSSGSWTINPGSITGSGTTYTVTTLAPANYNFTVTGVCASQPTANVVINPQPVPLAPIVGTITQPTCAGVKGIVVLNGLPSTGSWTINPGNISGTGSTATVTNLNPGTYNFTVTQNCNSLPSANVVITTPVYPPTPVISLNLNVLHSDAPIGNQWYNQSGIITGATAQNYNVVANGIYYTMVTVNGCSSDSSNMIQITTIGVTDVEKDNNIKIYPNPVTNELIIELPANKEKQNFEIYNAIGAEVYKGSLLEKTIIQTTGFAAGSYTIRLNNGKSLEFRKILKQ
ncbi:MAG: T9SS type A sorting domain-containing protein [Bacteroidetes bacterium]|nr:T9SS type A sorting domain-containing protein [Bacteroidota bacterium]